MTGVVPNNPPTLSIILYGISSNKQDLDGSDKSTISVFFPFSIGLPAATKYLKTSRKKTFYNQVYLSNDGFIHLVPGPVVVTLVVVVVVVGAVVVVGVVAAVVVVISFHLHSQTVQ